MPVNCNKENMRKWVEALESGKYRKTKGALHKKKQHGGGFCCLGVATDLYLKEQGRKWTRSPPGDDELYYLTPKQQKDKVRTQFEGEGGLLPPDVVRWLGLKDSNPVLANKAKGAAESVSATSANDAYDWSFKKIAAALRKRYGIEDKK